jgi:hypothetical protein
MNKPDTRIRIRINDLHAAVLTTVIDEQKLEISECL